MVKTMSLAAIEGYRGRGLPSGKYLRFFCPLHGGDQQRSFQLNPETGHFKCYGCGEWGYLQEKADEHRRAWAEEKRGGERRRPPMINVWQDRPEPEGDEGYERLQIEFEAAMPGSLAAKYLAHRGICPEMALKRFGVGFAADGAWPHLKEGRLVRQWKYGRVTFPHSTPAGAVVNFFGRAIGKNAIVPKEARHAHLPGAKGIFNAAALNGDDNDTVFVCEGPFDALSLVMAGYDAACAIFGTSGLRWNWIRARRVILCFDQDAAGQRWQALAYEGTVRGKEVYWLPADVYGGHKDLNAVWTANGSIELADWERTSRPLPKPSVAARAAS